VTSQQAWATEEAKGLPHLAWDVDRLDELHVSAFSSTPGSIKLEVVEVKMIYTVTDYYILSANG
jgi:hypothetical protein